MVVDVVGLVAGGAEPTRTILAIVVAFFCWGMAAQAFGARRTVRAAVVLWVLAGRVVLLAGLPAACAAVLVVPYVVTAWLYRNLDAADAARANQGWRVLLRLNYGCGFVVFWLCWWAWSH